MTVDVVAAYRGGHPRLSEPLVESDTPWRHRLTSSGFVSPRGHRRSSDRGAARGCPASAGTCCRNGGGCLPDRDAGPDASGRTRPAREAGPRPGAGTSRADVYRQDVMDHLLRKARIDTAQPKSSDPPAHDLQLFASSSRRLHRSPWRECRQPFGAQIVTLSRARQPLRQRDHWKAAPMCSL